MIRTLTKVNLAALAVIAVNVGGISSAQAAFFHTFQGPAQSARVTITPDGTGTTSHQVFDAAGASITCPQVDGEVNLGIQTTPLVLQMTNIQYTGGEAGSCKFVGQNATVKMNGCEYELVAAEPGTPGANGLFSIHCPLANEIEFSVPSPACKVTVPGTQSLAGITYHNISSKTEVTVEMHVTGIKYTATGAGCPTPGTQSNGNYTTGNYIMTAENSFSGVMTAMYVE